MMRLRARAGGAVRRCLERGAALRAARRGGPATRRICDAGRGSGQAARHGWRRQARDAADLRRGGSGRRGRPVIQPTTCAPSSRCSAYPSSSLPHDLPYSSSSLPHESSIRIRATRRRTRQSSARATSHASCRLWACAATRLAASTRRHLPPRFPSARRRPGRGRDDPSVSAPATSPHLGR